MRAFAGDFLEADYVLAIFFGVFLGVVGVFFPDLEGVAFDDAAAFAMIAILN